MSLAVVVGMVVGRCKKMLNLGRGCSVSVVVWFTGEMRLGSVILTGSWVELEGGMSSVFVGDDVSWSE